MSRSMRTVLVGILLLAWAGLPATAQPAAGGIQANMDKAGTTSRQSENGAVDAAPQKSNVSIVASKDKSLAKITLTQELAGGRLIGTLSTPVNMKEDVTPFFTLDGPAEDVQLGVAWKKQSYDKSLFAKLDFPERVVRQNSICNRLNVTPCTDNELQSTMKKAGVSAAKIARTLRSFNAFKLVDANRALPLYRAIPFHYWGFDGSIGRTERKFFDLPGAEKKDDRPSYSLAASYGRIFESSRFTFSLSTQRKFKEAEKARKCTVVEGSTLESCKDLPLGEASMVDSVPLAFEYRIWRGTFAVSPKLVYDFKRSVAAASLPIYLFADSTGKLTGGLRVDWEEHKHPVASVFVSSPLGLD